MYLPSPPTNEEQVLFLNSGRYKLYILSAVSTLLLVVGQILFVIKNPQLIPISILFFLTIFYIFISYLIGFLGKDFNYEKHRNLIAKWLHASISQKLDIYLPVCGEPIEVLKNTWTYVYELAKLHKGNLTVYVLDDGKSEVVRKESEGIGFKYITRENNELKKAGNLRNAFKQTQGEFFVIFDADFCPDVTFLINTLPYLYEYPGVAIVQTPQFFSYNEGQTSIQKGSGPIQELFYRLIQVNRNTFKGSICVGTNAVYRRSSLEQFGGTAAIGYSEDVRTGFRLQNAKQNIEYIPLNLAKGICPESLKQYFTQQYRWAMGSLDLFFSKEFWTSRLTKMQYLCYLTGMLYYLTTGLSVAMAFVPSIYLLIFKPEHIFWFNLMWSVPSLLLTNVYLRYWQKIRFTWAAVECRQISYYAHLFAVVDTIFNSAEEWIPTGSTVKSNRFNMFLRFTHIHLWTITILITTLVTYRAMTGYDIVNFIPIFLILIYYNLTILPIISEDQSVQ